MTFEGSLSMNFKSIKGAITHPFPVFITLGFLHIVMPLWAWGIGHIAFSGDTFTITGLILGMVIPTGITSFIWVSIHKGNTALTLAIILIDSLLSPFIVPFSLSLISRSKSRIRCNKYDERTPVYDCSSINCRDDLKSTNKRKSEG